MSHVCFEYAEVNKMSNDSEVFGSHPSSIIKHWDEDCLKNDKLLALLVVALCF